MKKALITVAAVLGFILTACTESEPKKETPVMSNEECLICGAPLEYLEQDTLMECVVCHKKEPSKTRCVKGHYVCSNCHTAAWTPSSPCVWQRPPKTLSLFWRR